MDVFEQWPMEERARTFQELLMEPEWMNLWVPLLGFDPRTMQEPWHPDGYKLRQLMHTELGPISVLLLRFEDILSWYRVFNRLIPGMNWTADTFHEHTNVESDHPEWKTQVELKQKVFILCESGVSANK